MAENVEPQLPESLECPLCLETFKNPTLLACGHTFCKVCLDQYDEQHRGQDFMECPLCKKRTKLEKNRVAGLAPNFSVKASLEEELHVHPRANGKSSEYCSLHSQVYKDILCEVCKEFICLTCLFDKHQGHRFKKKEEVKAELNKKRKSRIERVRRRKHRSKYLLPMVSNLRDMHSHLENLDMEIANSFREKSEILQGHRERLSKEVDDIRQKSGKVVTDFIGRQKHSLQKIPSKNINLKSTIMLQEGVASTSTCKFPDSDALKTRYMEFLDLGNELERDLNEKSVARAKKKVESTQFYQDDENVLDVGFLADPEASGNESESESESESDQHDMADLARIRKTFDYIANLSIPTELK